MKINKYKFDSGKYEVHAADDGSLLVAYRHGELWQNMIGDNLTAAMLHRVEELEAVLNKFVNWTTNEAGTKALGDDVDLWELAEKVLENK